MEVVLKEEADVVVLLMQQGPAPGEVELPGPPQQKVSQRVPGETAVEDEPADEEEADVYLFARFAELTTELEKVPPLLPSEHVGQLELVVVRGGRSLNLVADAPPAR